ncbi:DUF6188 family protein [Actinacidiphila glaucinigra]|uniref:DUF6188 family protein n=1 Tax=Actinacidiphila glaucinigra TaxID=235986 RepID=UPI0033C91B1C
MKAPTALIGGRVDRTSFDHQVRLSVVALDEDEGYRVDAELVLETEFLLRDTAGEWHELDSGTGSKLAPVLDLFGQSITAVDVRNHGSLTIYFDGGSGLWIGPHAQFESWHLSGLGVSAVIVGPGGESEWER